MPGSLPPQIPRFKFSSIELLGGSQIFACSCCGKLGMEVDLDVIFIAPLVVDFHRLLPPPLVGCLIAALRGGVPLENTLLANLPPCLDDCVLADSSF